MWVSDPNSKVTGSNYKRSNLTQISHLMVFFGHAHDS